VVGVTHPGPKPLGSTEAMERTRKSSPYYAEWIEACKRDLDEAIEAVRERDLAALGEITERSALAMHAAALAADPGIVYWKSATIEALHATRSLRAAGTLSFFTCDAGPQPKILCAPESEDRVVEALEGIPGILEIIRCRLGGGAEIV
jgi:diphosphomevalonate decarboxylase